MLHCSSLVLWPAIFWEEALELQNWETGILTFLLITLGSPQQGIPGLDPPHPSPLPGPSGPSLERNHPHHPIITLYYFPQTLEHLQYYRLYTGHFTANPPPNLYNKSMRWVSLGILNWGNWGLEQPHRLSEPGLQRYLVWDELWVPISLCFHLLYFISERPPGIRFGEKMGEFLFLDQPWTTNSSLPSLLPPTTLFPKWEQHFRSFAVHEEFPLRKNWWLQGPITCLVTPTRFLKSPGQTLHFPQLHLPSSDAFSPQSQCQVLQ